VHAAYGRFFANEIAAMVGITQTNQGTEDSVRILTVPFPASIAAWQAPGHKPPEPSTPIPSFVASVLPGVDTPYATTSRWASIGRWLPTSRSPPTSFACGGGTSWGASNTTPSCRSWVRDVAPTTSAASPAPRRHCSSTLDFGESWYKGLTLSVRKRLSHRYQLALAYTLSKAEDMIGDFTGVGVEDNGKGRNPEDPEGLPLGFDPSSERGPAGHDQRHRLVLSGLYRLPWDVQLSGILAASSGRPFNPVAGADPNGDGFPFPTDRARRDPADPTTGVGRNSETMAGEVVVDLRLSKRLRWGEGATLELMVEVFNLFNRTNFSEINNVFGVGPFPSEPQTDGQGRVTYGQYVKALPPRQIQLAAKLSF